MQWLATWTTHLYCNTIYGWLLSVPKEEIGQVNFQAVMDAVEGTKSHTTLAVSTNDHLAHYQ